MTHRTKPTACTRCEKTIDACTGISGTNAPEEDDITVCFYCQHVMQFNKDQSLRDASPEAIEETMLELSRIQNALTRKKAGL